MSSTRTFSNLNPEYHDLINTHFGSPNFLLFKYYSPIYEGLGFRGSVYRQLPSASEPALSGGSCRITHKADMTETSLKIKTSGEVQLTTEADLTDYAEGLQSTLKLYTDVTFGGIAAKLKLLWANKANEGLWIKSTLDWCNHRCLSSKVLKTIVNNDKHQLGLGAGLSFALEDKQLAIYNMTLWYIRNRSKFQLTHKTKRNDFSLGDLIAKIYTRVDQKTQVALGFRHNFAYKNDLITLATRYRHSDSFIMKSKIDSNMNLAMALQLNLDNNLQLVITSNYQVADSKSSQELDGLPPISLKLSFGEL